MAALFRGRLGRTSTVPPLEPIPAIADLPQAKMQASARYLGTLTVTADGGPGEADTKSEAKAIPDDAGGKPAG